MNKSIKFLAISLLMVPALVKAADDSSLTSYVWSGITTGVREVGTGFAGGLAGGATAAVGGELAAKVSKNELGQNALNAFIILGSAQSVQCVTQLTEGQLNIDNTNKTTFQKAANFAGSGAGWLTANVFVAGVIAEYKKRSGNN